MKLSAALPLKIKFPHFFIHMATLILFLISTLSIFCSVSADVSIDCGSSDTYTDDRLITWTGDGDIQSNGESRLVQNTNPIIALNTLRVFTKNKKNCYSFVADKGARVILRASFYYGNYDKKSSPPTFDLQFDGNHWATVLTSSTDYVYHEVTYVVKMDSVSVCVVQTKSGQFPFISALEVRGLDSAMYSRVDENYPLHLVKRVAYGASETIRYIDDPYDRIWTPEVGGAGLTSVASDAIYVETAGLSDQPPRAVVQNAVTAISPSGQIHLVMGFPPVDQNIPVYLNMYFSEVTQLDSTQNRSFQILLDNEPLMDQPITPPYGNCRELYAPNLTVSSNSSFTLVPTKEATLSPLISAMEVFVIGDVMTDGTNSKDVEGLGSLQDGFPVLQGWRGDPCLPSPYSWDWINCSSDPVPRVTALYLSSFDLSGKLPDFSSMDALETIDFHNNSLDGSIPEFLATLPNLKQLNLASNQFSGPIPDSLSKKKGINLVVTGNPNLCTSGNSCKTTSTSTVDNPGLSSSGSGKKNSKLPVILGTTIPTFIIIWAVLGIFFIMHHRRKTAASGQSGAIRPQSSPINPQMVGNIGQAIMNQIKVNMEDQGIAEIANQANGTTSVN